MKKMQESTRGDDIPPMFLTYATDLLGDTETGLSGPVIVSLTTQYAIKYDATVPHQEYPFDAPNKRTALRENLQAFAPSQQFQIIKELCDHPRLTYSNPEGVRELKLRLITRYGHLAEHPLGEEINEGLIGDTRHWLESYPECKRLYEEALQKHTHGVFQRNVVDDLRLSLEKLLADVLANSKSLENQLSELGRYVKERGCSPELANMFVKLLDYYSKYQNRYVKHDDAVVEEEIELVFEITSSFMKHIVRLTARQPSGPSVTSQ